MLAYAYNLEMPVLACGPAVPLAFTPPDTCFLKFEKWFDSNTFLNFVGFISFEVRNVHGTVCLQVAACTSKPRSFSFIIQTTLGGYCIIGMREAFLDEVPEYKDRLEPYLRGLEGWKFMKKDRVPCPNWIGPHKGVVFVFQKNDWQAQKRITVNLDWNASWFDYTNCI